MNGSCEQYTVAPTTPAPCKPGQYRSEETGRCRNNPIVAAQTPCTPGQERNPATNRCRKVVSGGDAAAGFAVVATPGDMTSKTWSWLALGGVGMLALGYVV